jgi:hypothetical protein
MNMQLLISFTDIAVTTEEPLLIINDNSLTGECQLKNF